MIIIQIAPRHGVFRIRNSLMMRSRIEHSVARGSVESPSSLFGRFLDDGSVCFFQGRNGDPWCALEAGTAASMMMLIVRRRRCRYNSLDGRWWSCGRSSLETKNVIQFHHSFIAVSSPTLSPLSQTSKGKVVQLTSKTGKGTVVKVEWQDIGFHLESIMYHNASQSDLSLGHSSWTKGNDLFVFCEHVYQTSATTRKERSDGEKDTISTVSNKQVMVFRNLVDSTWYS